MRDIFTCVEHLYHEVSKHARGNELIITIRAKDYVPGGVATLIAYLKLQEKWPHALPWRLEVAKGEGGDGSRWAGGNVYGWVEVAFLVPSRRLDSRLAIEKIAVWQDVKVRTQFHRHKTFLKHSTVQFSLFAHKYVPYPERVHSPPIIGGLCDPMLFMLSLFLRLRTRFCSLERSRATEGGAGIYRVMDYEREKNRAFICCQDINQLIG